MSEQLPLCPLCGRPITPCQRSRHHLIPKTFKGKEVVVLHKICHKKIHSLFTERQLLKHYNTVSALRSHPDMQTFIRWLENKPPEFYVATRTSVKKRR